MTYDHRIDGIIFDMDGTLYHMKWFMVPLFYIALFPHSRRLPEYMKVRNEFMGKDLGDGDRLLDAMASVMRGDREKIKRWIAGAFYDRFVGILGQLRDSRPGLADLMQKLRSNGRRCAVLSDFARIRERLQKLRIDPGLFDPIVSSEECGALKPAVRPFGKIVEQWKLKPENVLIVGDRDDTDGAAARNLGASFLRITDNSRPPTGAFHWTQVREILTGL